MLDFTRPFHYALLLNTKQFNAIYSASSLNATVWHPTRSI